MSDFMINQKFSPQSTTMIERTGGYKMIFVLFRLLSGQGIALQVQ